MNMIWTTSSGLVNNGLTAVCSLLWSKSRGTTKVARTGLGIYITKVIYITKANHRNEP